MTRLVLYLICIVFASSCVTKSINKVNFSLPPQNSKELISRVNSNNQTSEWLALKGTVSLFLKSDSEVSLGISIRVKKDSIIWASVTAPFGIEVFRAALTKDSIYYINRTNRTYFIKPISNISKILKTDIAFNDIQQILAANPKIVKNKYSFKRTNDNFMLTASDYIYTVSNSFRIISGVQIEKGISLIYTYSNFIFENNFPEQLEFLVKSPSQNEFNLTINYSKVVFGQEQKTSFKIPKSYVEAE